MSREKLKEELKSIAAVMVFFGIWIGVFLCLKSLLLAEYQIGFHHFSALFVGSLILSKVVVLMKNVNLLSSKHSSPAWINVLLRTLLYGIGVLIVLILEHGIEGRHESGGFGPAVLAAFKSTNAPHVWADSIVITGALLVYNAAGVVESHLGKRGLARLFKHPLPKAEPES